MSASKMDHKELQRRLKEDEIAHFFQEMRENVSVMVENHGRQVGLILGLILVVVIAMYFWKVKTSNDYADSQQLYANAVSYVQDDQYPQALTELDSLQKNYSGEKIAVPGLVLRGDCYIKTGEYDLALKDYRAAVSKMSPEDGLIIRFAIVQTLRSLNQFDEALQELDTIEKQANAPIMKEQVAYLRGCCYEDKDDTGKALEAFKTIGSKSKWYSLATEQIAWLEAQPAEAINAK